MQKTEQSRCHLNRSVLLARPEGFWRRRFRVFGGMSKQSTGLFLCRSLPRLRSVFAPIPGSNPSAKKKAPTARVGAFSLEEPNGLDAI